MALSCPRCYSSDVSKRPISLDQLFTPWSSYSVPSRYKGRVTGAYSLECRSCGKSATAISMKERC